MSRDQDERVEDLLGRWAERRRAGEEVSADDLIRENPDVADELRAGIATARKLGNLLPRDDASPPPPARVGEFHVLCEIGRGGMGVVYEAEQPAMRRRVALKVLYPSITNTAKTIERFKREARAAGQLKHTNIVTVHQLGEDAGVWYCAMELVEGHSLDRVIEDVRRLRPSPRGKSPRRTRAPSTGAADLWRATTGERRYFQRVAEMFAEIADALQLAHEHGVVHRDVKPANLMVSADGRLKILDFGLARIREEPTGLTVTGGIIGTPSYMSPEQARSGEIDARTDVYSLGATLYEVLTLRPPFHANDVAEILQRLRAEEPRRPSRVDRRIPRDLETIVLKALEKERAKRYATAGELAKDLRAFAEGRTIAARRVGPLARAWRLAKRQKVRAGLAAALVAAVAVASALAVREARARDGRVKEEARRIDLEYLNLCAQAEEAFHAQAEDAVGASPFELFSRAIELAPQRHEAYMGRVLCRQATDVRPLADADAAEKFGAPKRTVHLARAFALRELGREGEADLEERAAASCATDDLRSKLLEAWIASARGDIDQCLPLLDAAIAGAPNGSAVRYLARRGRAKLRLLKRRYDDALADLLTLRESGDANLWVALQIAYSWKRLGQATKADACFSELMSELRAESSRAKWNQLAASCNYVAEWPWLERAATEGLAAFPEDPALLAWKGWSASKVGQTDEALAILTRAAGADPQLHEAQCILSIVYRMRKEWRKAADAARRAIELGTSCPTCPRSLSVALVKLNDLPSALQAAEMAVRRGRLDPQAYFARGHALSNMGREDDALREYEHALSLDPANVEALIFRAESQRNLGRLDAALAEYDRALKISPGNARVLRHKARVLDLAQKWDEALATAEAAVKADPKDAVAHESLGVALMRFDRYDEAVLEFEESVKLDPTDAYLWGNLGNCRLDRGEFEEALAALDRSLELEPKHGLNKAHRAAALNGLNRLDEALDEADAAIMVDPRESEAHWARGVALVRLKRIPDGVAALERALAIDPKTPKYPIDLGLALQLSGKPDEAMSAFMRGLDLGYENSVLLNNVAWWLARRPDRDTASLRYALDLVERATVLAPTEGDIWNTYGAILAISGRGEKALEALAKSMELRNGGDAGDWFFVAMAHKRLGHDAEARTWFDKSVEWATEHKPKDEELARIQREAAAALGLAPAVETPATK